MYHFIFNKKASSGQGLAIWNTIKQTIDQRKIPHIVHMTEHKEEAIRIVRELSDGANHNDPAHIVVIGGDGSLNAIMQGIINFDSVKLSIIPAGSGNDFAKALGISNDPAAAIQHLLSSPTEKVIDFGVSTFVFGSEETKSNRFLISSGTGYDADICEEVNRSKVKAILNKIHLGQIVYLFIGLKKIFGFKSYIKKNECDATITFDDKESIHIDNMFLTVAMNTPYQGGGAPFCPTASWTDGLFDICSVDSMTTPKLLLCILLVYFKKHYIFKQVNHYQCQKLHVEMKKERWLHTDGETMGETKSITMECKQGLHFVY